LDAIVRCRTAALGGQWNWDQGILSCPRPRFWGLGFIRFVPPGWTGYSESYPI